MHRYINITPPKKNKHHHHIFHFNLFFQSDFRVTNTNKTEQSKKKLILFVTINDELI